MLYDYLGVWAVVNNAGFNIHGDVELSTIDQYKKCAEVNLYGMIRVIKAFLPMIRVSRGGYNLYGMIRVIKAFLPMIRASQGGYNLYGIVREKGRDLTKSYDESPYTNRNVKRAK